MPYITADGTQFDSIEEANSHQSTLPEPPTPVNDVEKEDLEKAAPAKALVVEDAQLARADVAEAMAATKDGSDNASLKRAVEALAKALDTVLAKLAGEHTGKY